MRFIDEYRNSTLVKNLAEKITYACQGNWTLMEVCGGQTHNIFKFGIEELLPDNIKLIHGPGCPVCVIPVEYIDKAISISGKPDVILVTYGDMLRVPGSRKDLLTSKAEGNDIKIIYSPLDAVSLAVENPHKKVVFFAIGFETTAPANAAALITAQKKSIKNFSMLSAHVLIPPAIEYLLSSGEVNIQGILAPGHVCTVTGYKDYLALCEKYKVPISVCGFEPLDLLYSILTLIRLLEDGIYDVTNQYARSVRFNGNLESKRVIEEVYDVTDRKWRGIGVIPHSGLRLKKKYSEYDAEKIFHTEEIQSPEYSDCISGDILKGIRRPNECPAFLTKCTPENPLGAPMVSSEGVCSAYYRYKNYRNSQ